MIILVPERPSLENRELSPVPDVVSPTSPILAQSYHNQNTYSQPRTVSRRDMRQGEVTREDMVVVSMLFIPESLSPRTVQSSTLDRKGAGEVAEVHTNTSATLGRQRLRSRIPTAHARHHAAPSSCRRCRGVGIIRRLWKRCVRARH